MDEDIRPATGSPAPGTDQANEQSTSQAPAASAAQGDGTPLVDEVPNDERAPSQDADLGQDGAGQPVDGQAMEAQAAPTDSAPTGAEPTDAVPTDAEPQQAAGGVVTDDASAQAALDAMVQEAASPEASAAASASAASGSPAFAAEEAAEESGEITMEDVLAASDEQLARKPVHRGMITTGQIIMLQQEGMVVDVGAKIEGILPYNQLFEFETNQEQASKYFKPGDEIQVYVVRSDIANNTIVLSKKRADQERAWNLLQEIFEKQKPVEVQIVEKVRGGLVANLGVRAFLPASQVDVRRVNDLSPYVGQRLKVRIIELNRRRNRVIISRRAILEEEIAHLKEETLKRLEPGARLEGEVVEITDFGVFVNLGGIDGLVHRSELTHGRFNHPRDVVKLGDKVRVEVLDMDLERERINLSMKKLAPNPWENVLANYAIGQRISGRVTNLTPFGAFVEIEPGLEGLIHVSEMSWTKRVRHPKEIVDEGEQVEAMILKIDTQQQRISLGLRQTQPDPWSSLPDRYPPGTEITGPITGITDFGVFMEIEEGIEGLVHISELSHDHIENIADHFNKGDEITAVILNIDPVEQRASLSRKRLMPYTAENAAEFGGNQPAGGGRGAYAGGQQGGGQRRGRRGRRGASDIDYDYSYVAAEAGGKTTTKLGDVYADLFAQFGLTDTKGEPKAESADAADADEQGAQAVAEAVDAAGDSGSAESAAEVAGSVSESELAQAVVETTGEGTGEAPAEAGEAQAEAEPAEEEKPKATAKAQSAEAEEEVDPADAIDAAEAAALLTAAFRQGRRPAKAATDLAAEAAPTATDRAAEAAPTATDRAETAPTADGQAETALTAEGQAEAASDGAGGDAETAEAPAEEADEEKV